MEKYVEAELEVIEFDEEDVITSSCTDDDVTTPEVPINNS
jgi:hypothetical protein